jgi:hypothetical protein
MGEYWWMISEYRRKGLLIELGFVLGAIIEYVFFEHCFVELPFCAKRSIDLLRCTAGPENVV